MEFFYFSLIITWNYRYTHDPDATDVDDYDPHEHRNVPHPTT